MPLPRNNWTALPVVLSLPETARILRVSVSRVRAWARDGSLPLVPHTGEGTGVRALVSRDRLREWTREGRVRETPAETQTP